MIGLYRTTRRLFLDMSAMGPNCCACLAIYLCESPSWALAGPDSRGRRVPGVNARMVRAECGLTPNLYYPVRHARSMAMARLSAPVPRRLNLSTPQVASGLLLDRGPRDRDRGTETQQSQRGALS